MAQTRYTVTYVFDGRSRAEYTDAVSLIEETIGRMQREGVDIEFLGATAETDAADQLVEVTARYAAPTKGSIGWLNCRARLPASGPPQRVRTDNAETEKQDVPVARG
ncbi:hypothetical protein [Halostella pelagica]|uniref:hypothetical protein n=1 Tax=Halostella pelagica TaxID=2583824 RepID=UPI0010802598|nr:hypothetical protein [Halostella pelagica]